MLISTFRIRSGPMEHEGNSARLVLGAIRSLLLRDAKAVIREIEAYPDDELPWRLAPGISNSAGTLALHLAGNLEHFVGAVLGDSGYVRDREAEFSTRDLTRIALRERLHAAVASVDAALAELEPERLQAEYPLPVGGRRVRTADYLIHLAVHLGYHLGQIDYHRRMLDPEAFPVGAVSVTDLPEHPSVG